MRLPVVRLRAGLSSANCRTATRDCLKTIKRFWVFGANPRYGLRCASSPSNAAQPIDTRAHVDAASASRNADTAIGSRHYDSWAPVRFSRTFSKGWAVPLREENIDRPRKKEAHSLESSKPRNIQTTEETVSCDLR